jgi:hypothetical protein
MPHSVSSDIHHSQVPTASKWTVRKVRGGVAGDVTWVLGLMSIGGSVLKEFTITRQLGETLDNLQPGAILRKVFGCGTQKDLEKH